MNETNRPSKEDDGKLSSSFILIGLFVLILDQLTKGLVYLYLPVIDPFSYSYPYDGIGIFKHFAGIEFSINHMTNTGAAWGILANYQFPLILLRIGLICVLLLYLVYFNHHPSWRLPFILIIAGAFGNVVDFFLYGHVIDMFHFVFWGYDFPVFNLADSAISIGIFSLFFLSFTENSADNLPKEGS
ncbi:MAG: signal peptidase II [Parachlamydiaceae bacterium]